jgi:hypothetical protein
MNVMEATIAANDRAMGFNRLEEDYSVIYDEVSDEELEIAASGLLASGGSAGGWMTTTAQCCSPYDL